MSIDINDNEDELNICVACLVNVGQDPAVQCQWCDKWEHKTCLNLTDTQYKQIGKAVNNKYHPEILQWYQD